MKRKMPKSNKFHCIDILDPSPMMLFDWFGITPSNSRRANTAIGNVNAADRNGWKDLWPDAAFGGLDLSLPLDIPYVLRKIYCLRLHGFVTVKRKSEKLSVEVVPATENLVFTAMPFTTFLAKLLAAKVLRNVGENEAADKVWS